MTQTTRRTFLAGAVAGAGALATARLSRAANGASREVQLAVIGCGWRGGQLLDAFRKVPGVRIGALCDVDESRIAEHADKAPGAFHTTDLRRVLDRGDIDAVVVATCNHWHCLAALWALEAGKHLYVEKPLFHNHWEGRRLVDAVKEHGKVCQIGTQQRSDPMQAEIKDFLHRDAAIGKPQFVRVNRFGVRKPIGKRDQPLPIPPVVDFDTWCGPAAEQPIYRDALHYDWHWDFNTGSGEMGNWGVHIIDDVRNNVFLDAVGAPASVSGAGGRYVWNDAGDTPNLQLALLDAGGVPVSIGVCNLTAGPDKEGSPATEGPGSGYTVVGENGRLEGQRAGAVAFDADGGELRRFKGTGGMSEHVRNFIEAVRNDDPAHVNAPVQVGFDSTVWCDFGNIAARVASADGTTEPPAFVEAEVERMKSILAAHGLDGEAERFSLGAPLEFDAATERFVGPGAEPANQLLRRDGREPFTIA